MNTNSQKRPREAAPAPADLPSQKSEVSGIAAGVMAGAVQGAVQGADTRSNAAAEEAYWREHFPKLPWVQADATYEEYAPAFALGWEAKGACSAGPGQATFDLAEPDLRAQWQQRPAAAGLPWDLARPAALAAWERVQQAMSSGDDAKPGAR